MTASALIEARCLLSLPPGTGPKLLDIVWQGSGRLILYLERLQGRTLDAVAKETPLGQVPRLAQELCETLTHLHRAGWIHADLKPENVLSVDGADGFDIRLLDFGYAIDRFGLLEPRRYGGTPPYMAPELERGWIADERADLYSLGVVLRRLFPNVEKDAKWGSILDQLCARVPGERFQDARSASDAISETFGLKTSPNRLPRFGSGPMIGRDPAIQLVLRAVRSRPGARLLVQGLPGTGLSRFLAEAVVTVAAAKGPPIRVVDLTGLSTDGILNHTLEYLRGVSANEGAIICAVADPSPGLRWLGERAREQLLAIVSGSQWERLDLPPLDLRSHQEIVSASLGRAGAESDRLGSFLHTASEGDLHQAASVFLHAIRTSGQEQESGWSFDASCLKEALSTWRDHTESVLKRTPTHLRGALSVCARAGPSFPESVVRALLIRFAEVEALPALLDHGYLRRDGPGHLSFVTQGLWAEIVRTEDEQAQEIDAWLNSHASTDPDRIDEVLHLASLAREIGDPMRAIAALSDALTRAHSKRRWSDVIRLLSYPDDAPSSWTLEMALERIARLQRILGPPWSEGRLLVVAGASLKSVTDQVWIQLLNRAAIGSDAQVKISALILLADHSADETKSQAYEQYRATLQGLDLTEDPIAPGVLDFLDARRAMACGRSGEALQLAEKAAVLLKGSGLVWESLNLQLVAILQPEQESDAAVATLQAAVATAEDPELNAQIRYNLALFCGRIGRFDLAAECCDTGIRILEQTISSPRLIQLRIQRAWSWAHLGQIDRAKEETSSMLQLPTTWYVLKRLLPLRLLLGFCHLHRGFGREAINEVSQALRAAGAGAPADLRADCLRALIDTLFEINGLESIRARTSEFDRPIPGNSRAIATTNARMEAALSQAMGDVEDAAVHLEGQLDAARRLRHRLATARYLHHLGLVRVGQHQIGVEPKRIDQAVQLFQEEMEVLGTSGPAYYRARAYLSLATALRGSGMKRSAAKARVTATTLARANRCRGLLAECLSE